MQIEKYQITYTGKKDGSTFWRAFIHLSDENGQYLGGIYFYNDDTPTSWNDGYSGSGLFMFLPASHFSRIVDLLRNEKPLYFTYNDHSQKTYLSTSAEPVGEEELALLNQGEPARAGTYLPTPYRPPYPYPYPWPFPSPELYPHPPPYEPFYPTPRVVEIGPDFDVFAHKHNSIIWVTFNWTIDPPTVTPDTFIVKVYPDGEEVAVEGARTVLSGGRTAYFRPDGDYPTGTGDTHVKVILVGTDKGSGAIKSRLGTALDGNGDGRPGGDFEHEFLIVG